MPFGPISFRPIFVLSSHLCLCLPSIFVPSCPIHCIETVTFQSRAGQIFFSVFEQECLALKAIASVNTATNVWPALDRNTTVRIV